MKKYTLRLTKIALLFALALVSCEDYLDKAPEATISENDIFTNFVSYQGFVEEMYNCVTDYNKAGAWNQSNYADETLYNLPLAFDDGNYWNQSALFYGTAANTNNETRTKRIWPLCWYGIRKANIALNKLDLLIDATEEEKDLIKGQALFFRGWFYFELMRYWGGMPYIDEVLSPTAEMKLPRLNYRETALKAAQDLKDAAPLLPVNWDDTEAGKRTLGHNRQRISKIHALSFLGKDLLYAASPMMNEESTGNATYDTQLCQEAASVFAEVIKICNETGVFKLQSWETWTDNFWVWSNNRSLMSGGTEVIMNPLPFNATRISASMVQQLIPANLAASGTSTTEVPAHNFIKNYSMTNGLPIEDPASGYNPDDPWTGREPRFYKDIIIDGDELVASDVAGPDRYAQLYTGGRHRANNGSVSGYYYKRWTPKGINKYQVGGRWGHFMSFIPYMRLADVYLMYAEAALHGYGTAYSKAPGGMTAEEALNTIRNRAQLPNLDSKFTATKDDFMGGIIRERAVELAYEAHRFCDLRRWNLAGEMKYKEKTAIEFDRDPVTKRPVNIRERVVVTRVFDKKHNWLPIQVQFTKQYSEFPQNPGW